MRLPYPEAVFRDYAADIAELVQIPVILVGLNSTPAGMENPLHTTKIAYFSLSRPLIREPDLINQWRLNPNEQANCISFATIRGDLRQMQWFHTDRGSEFKNEKINGLLETFEIGRSLSMKGCPYNNAVAEATYKIMKTEFIHQMSFHSLQHLELELYDYANWFNKHWIHGTLGYLTPVQFRQKALKKVV